MIIENGEYERDIVQEAIDGIKEDLCTETSFYKNWCDMAESYIDDALCDLDSIQLSLVCAEFRNYIYENAPKHYNLCMGIREASIAVLDRICGMTDTLTREEYRKMYDETVREADENGEEPPWGELEAENERVLFAETLAEEILEFKNVNIGEYDDGREYDIDEDMTEEEENAENTPAALTNEIPLDRLIPYHDHRFELYTGDRLSDMAESIKNNGVLVPIIVCEAEGGMYEILSGHNRVNAARIAGLTEISAVVKKDLTEEEMEMYVIETNFQRGFGDLKITEQAAVVALRHSKMFNSAKQREISEELNILSGNISDGKKSSKLAIAGEEYGLSKNSAARLIRVDRLVGSFKSTPYRDKLTAGINGKALSIRAAVELSYIPKEALAAIFDRHTEAVYINDMRTEVIKLSDRSAKSYREIFKDFKDGDPEKVIEAFLWDSKKENKPKAVKFKPEIIAKYFTDNESENYINGIIDKALEFYFMKNKAI